MTEMKKVNDMAAEQAAGGFAGVDYVHDLNHFVCRTVINLPAGTCLQMQLTPNGKFMSQMYNQGDAIFVHDTFWENGYLLAFRNGVYGFVDAKYVG